MSTATQTNDRTVLVVDDHRTVADLLRLAIDAEPELRCVGVAYDTASALTLTTSLQPHVVVSDLNLEQGRPTGLGLTSLITAQHPAIAVLLITGDPGDLRLDDLRASGAAGLLAKDGDLAALISAIRRADRDQLDIDPKLLRCLTRPAAAPSVSLSPRELDVLTLMDQGRDVVAISRLLGIQPTTCRGYVKSLLHKLGAHSQLQAVARAREAGLLGRRG